jgi:hypothetical protein
VVGGVDAGSVTTGTIGVSCVGGTAIAKGGDGGTPVLLLFGRGGNSGRAFARGGTGCSGVRATPVTTGPILAGAALGSPGAICPPAVCAGT